MRRLILGTAGHIDHGKTALVRALTGVDTDRLPEEKRRGITIDLGFANLIIDGETEIGIVDVPGHEAFIRNMLAGATGIDLALLVVAADEGVMPQTREHVDILELLGVRKLVVALTKADLADDEWIDLVAEDARRLLSSGSFAAAPLVRVSVKTGQGIDLLLQTLAAAAREMAERDADDLFRLPIDRVFSVRGTGTVVTGTVWSGRVERDSGVRLLPAGETFRIRGIQSHGSDRPVAAAGTRAAIALASTSKSAIRRGDVLVEGTGWMVAQRVTAKVRVLPDAPAIRAGTRIRFHLGTAEVMGRIVPLEPRPIGPGDEAWVHIRLEEPVVARARDPFVLRSFSPVATIGGGRIGEPSAPRRKRPAQPAMTRLEQILRGSVPEVIEAATVLAGWNGVPIDRLPTLTSLAPGQIAAELRRNAAVSRIGNHLFPNVVLGQAEHALVRALDAHHRNNPLSPGLPREELKQSLADASPILAEWVVQKLAAAGQIETEAHHVRRSGFVPALLPDQQKAADAILAEIHQAGLAAPSDEELSAELSGRRDCLDLVHYLVRAGLLVALPQNRFINPDVLADAIRLARGQLGARQNLSPGDFRDLFGISRKYLIPLLEHLDRTAVTVRTGEERRISSPPKLPEPSATSS
jgi:selenocysteine-specific elongation factor